MLIMNNDENSQCLSRLQELHFVIGEQTTPEKNADGLRNIITHLRFSFPESIDASFQGYAHQLSKEYEDYYKMVMDSSDAKTGLNNFAEGALSLCAQNKNESHKWVSSFSEDKLRAMSCVKDYLTRCQSESLCMLPERSLSTPLPFVHDVTLSNQPGPIFRPSNVSTGNEGKMEGVLEELGVPECSAVKGSAMLQTNILNQQHAKPSSVFTFTQENHMDDGAMGEKDSDRPTGKAAFRTAKEQFLLDQSKKGKLDRNTSNFSYGSSKKSLGTRRGPSNRFIPPVINKDSDWDSTSTSSILRGVTSDRPDAMTDDRLKGIDQKIVEMISNEIMDHKPNMDWDDIAGLNFAKKTIKEIVVWPMLRPDIFTGLRGPPKGLLLFGPPGTGKTLIGKCIASQSKSTFFCISASSLTSKWVGEGEKLVRALFAVSRCHQPAVIFIDEVDSLLSQRSDGEHEASRRIKTEFLIQLDGATTECEDRILVIGATNRPQEIDEAARRRFVKRLYIPLPELVARQHIVTRLMSQQQCQLNEADITAISLRTEGYSGADMTNLCREAALGPIRSIPFEQMATIQPEQVRPITIDDFEAALLQVRPSVSNKDLDLYIEWNNSYGSFG